jgi:hypothetical protein
MKQLTDYRIDGLGKGMCLQGNDSTAVATNATSTTSTSTYTSNNNNKNNKTTTTDLFVYRRLAWFS